MRPAAPELRALDAERRPVPLPLLRRPERQPREWRFALGLGLGLGRGLGSWHPQEAGRRGGLLGRRLPERCGGLALRNGRLCGYGLVETRQAWDRRRQVDVGLLLLVRLVRARRRRAGELGPGQLQEVDAAAAAAAAPEQLGVQVVHVRLCQPLPPLAQLPRDVGCPRPAVAPRAANVRRRAALLLLLLCSDASCPERRRRRRRRRLASGRRRLARQPPAAERRGSRHARQRVALEAVPPLSPELGLLAHLPLEVLQQRQALRRALRRALPGLLEPLQLRLDLLQRPPRRLERGRLCRDGGNSPGPGPGPRPGLLVQQEGRRRHLPDPRLQLPLREGQALLADAPVPLAVSRPFGRCRRRRHCLAVSGRPGLPGVIVAPLVLGGRVVEHDGERVAAAAAAVAAGIAAALGSLSVLPAAGYPHARGEADPLHDRDANRELRRQHRAPVCRRVVGRPVVRRLGPRRHHAPRCLGDDGGRPPLLACLGGLLRVAGLLCVPHRAKCLRP